MMQRKILVVDDEENMLALLRRVLNKEGYQVECAGSGERGLDLLAESGFSLAIIDLSMPGMDGIGFLARMKEMHPELPVIIVTAFPSWEKEQTARSLGCAGYLLKPLDIRRLKRVIREILKKARSSRR